MLQAISLLLHTTYVVSKEVTLMKRMSVVWNSSDGLSTVRTIATTDGAITILGTLEDFSNAIGFQRWESDVTVNSETPSTDAYLSVTQIAVLLFSDDSGNLARLSLPAPLSSIFMADGSTVDPSTITSIISACIGNLLTGAGTEVTMFKGGYLQGARASGSSTS
jgi:hypothetical protein